MGNAASGGNSFVSAAQSDDMSGPTTSGMFGGWQGLGNTGWTVNFGGKGLNLQGGASEPLMEIPWFWLGVGALVWWAVKKGKL